MSGIIFRAQNVPTGEVNIADGKTSVGEKGHFFTTHVGDMMQTRETHYAHVTTFERDSDGFPQRGWQVTLFDGQKIKITFLGEEGTLTHLECTK